MKLVDELGVPFLENRSSISLLETRDSRALPTRAER